MTNNGNSMKINDDVSYLSTMDQKPRGALVVKRSLHSNASRFRHRRLRKKIFSKKENHSSPIFRSTGMKKNSNKHRTSKRIQTLVDDRLKRFRMLDPDEFQEMLNSWSYQVPDQSVKELDNMDTIGGMQLESTMKELSFLHKNFIRLF